MLLRLGDCVSLASVLHFAFNWYTLALYSLASWLCKYTGESKCLQFCCYFTPISNYSTFEVDTIFDRLWLNIIENIRRSKYVTYTELTKFDSDKCRTNKNQFGHVYNLQHSIRTCTKTYKIRFWQMTNSDICNSPMNMQYNSYYPWL